MDCKFPICTDICIRHHDGHHFEPIKDLRCTIEQHSKLLIDEIEVKTKSYTTSGTAEAGEKQKIKKELDDRKQHLISIIESKYGKLTNELHEIYQKCNRKSRTVDDNQSVTALRIKQAALEEIMTRGDIEQIVKRFDELKTEVKDLLQTIPAVTKMSFHPGDADVRFGSLSIKATNTSIGDISSVSNIEIVRRIKTNLRDVDMICPNSNDTTWIGGQNDANVQLIRNSSGTSINQIKNNFSNGYVRSDKLYMCSLNEKSVLTISLDGTVSRIKDMQPFYPLCVYVTSHNDILVGAVDELDNYKINEGNRSVLMTLNDKGEVTKELKLDANGVKLFVKPYRCIVNEQTNDLVVLDRTSGGSGRIVCISTNDDVKFRYSGRSPAELTCEFNPTAIVFANNCIIACDFSNRALDIIGQDGSMIKSIPLDITGVSSLCFDTLGQLWIGNHDKNQAEIFITRLK